MAASSLTELLHLTGSDFEIALLDLLTAKGQAGQELEPLEMEAHLLLSMEPRINMNGFVDLFYQCYPLAGCLFVENSLKNLGLNELAGQFARAKWLYVGGRTDITEEEYREIDPFGNDERWQEFDRIGEAVLKGGELYLIGERLERHIKAIYGR